MLLVIGAVFSTIGGVVVFRTTSQSNFCNKCHLMEPYYQSWQRSKHAQVECTACHMPPGIKGKVLTKFQALTQLTKYVTRTWGTRPWGHVTDASCLECHDVEKLKKQGAKAFGSGLRFDHGPHLSGQARHKTLTCTTCHKQVERSVHMQVATQACYTCHFKPGPDGNPTKLATCTTCHAGAVHKDASFSIPRSAVVTHASKPGADCQSCHRQVVDGEGRVPAYRCAQCHDDKGVMKAIEKVDDLHQVHVTKAGTECGHCHTEITHARPKVAAAPAALDCQQCHAAAHDAQIRMFTGQLLPGGQPSGMHRAGLQCASCHMPVSAGGKPKLELKPSACGGCHDPALSARALLWAEGVGKLTAELDRRAAGLAGAGAGGAKLADELRQKLAALTRAHAVHNLPHARAVLDDVDARLRAALSKADAAKLDPLPHQRWDARENCTQCHFASVAMPGAYRGKTFSHEAHRGVLKEARCDACHDTAAPARHGALKGTSCASCHHAEAPKGAPQCGSCHADQKRMYAGKFPELGLEVAPIWSDKACKDCHAREGGKTDAPEMWAGCASCHDPGYDTAMKTRLSGYAARKAKLMTRTDERSRALRQLLESDRSGGAHHPALTEKVLDLLEGK